MNRLTDWWWHLNAYIPLKWRKGTKKDKNCKALSMFIACRAMLQIQCLVWSSVRPLPSYDTGQGHLWYEPHSWHLAMSHAISEYISLWFPPVHQSNQWSQQRAATDNNQILRCLICSNSRLSFYNIRPAKM